MSRRTVVFDVGGVLVRWQPLELMRTHLGLRDDAAARAAMVQVFQTFAPEADWGAFDRGEIEPEPLAERIAARTGFAHASLAALIAAIPHHLQPMPDSVALLERVRAAGHRLALLSNMPRPYADHLERAHACFGWFEHRTWSGYLGVMKPQRAIFDHVRDALGLDLDHAIFIDDHHGNIAAAHRYGWQALQFSTAAQCEGDLRAAGWL